MNTAFLSGRKCNNQGSGSFSSRKSKYPDSRVSQPGLGYYSFLYYLFGSFRTLFEGPYNKDIYGSYDLGYYISVP